MSRAAHRLRVLEAAMVLVLVAGLLKALPFRVVVRLAGTVAPGRPAGGMASNPVVRAVGDAVAVAARRLPWRPVCLPQTLAAGLMLRCRSVRPQLRLGVRRQDDTIRAHAWLTVDGPAGGEVFGGTAAEFVPFATLRPAPSA